MAVPVQTWGSMANMVADQREFGTRTAEYLEANEVYDMFGDLLQELIKYQPENPIKFMQERLMAKSPLRVCIIGPPGINRSSYCARIASEFGIAHVHVGKALRARGDLDATINAGALVEDGIVIAVVKEELLKVKPGQGFVLDGFPRSKVQAQALSERALYSGVAVPAGASKTEMSKAYKRVMKLLHPEKNPDDPNVLASVLGAKDAGMCLDRILLLHTSESAVRERYAAKISALGGHSDTEKDDVINTRLQQYQRHVISIAELCKNIIRQIQVTPYDDDQDVTYNAIRSSLHVRPHSNAPHRPHRICVVGPCASGRTTQCKALAKMYGLVHVDVSSLLSRRQLAAGKTPEDIPPEHVGDVELSSIVGQRVNEIDCLRKGWILDGFPKTQSQAEFLRQSHLWPTRLIILQAAENDVASRAASRRVDPATGVAYYQAPSSITIRQRLIQSKHDELDAVKARYKFHTDNVDRVMQAFPTVAFPVPSDGGAAEVTKLIRARIDQPTSTELAQNPQDQEES